MSENKQIQIMYKIIDITHEIKIQKNENIKQILRNEKKKLIIEIESMIDKKQWIQRDGNFKL